LDGVKRILALANLKFTQVPHAQFFQWFWRFWLVIFYFVISRSVFRI